jgi:hypothetical protein
MTLPMPPDQIQLVVGELLGRGFAQIFDCAVRVHVRLPSKTKGPIPSIDGRQSAPERS